MIIINKRWFIGNTIKNSVGLYKSTILCKPFNHITVVSNVYSITEEQSKDLANHIIKIHNEKIN